MEIPEPDGHLTIVFREPYHNKARYTVPGGGLGTCASDYELTYQARDIKGLVIESEGIRVRKKDGASFHPWTAIQETRHIFNSEEYQQALKEYQETHEHTWVCTNEYNHAALMPGFYWYCGANKDGSDEGCGASEFRAQDDLGRTLDDYVKFEGLGSGGED